MREEIEARPSATLIVGLILGIVVFSHPPALAFLAAFAVWLRPMRCKSLLAVAFVVGMVLAPLPVPMLQSGTPLEGYGVIASVPQLYPDVQQCEFRIGARTLILSLPRNAELMLGDRVYVSGIAKPLQSTPMRSAVLEGIQGRMAPTRFKLVREGSWVAHLADRWRRSFVDFAEQSLSPRDAVLVDALCFNARTLLDPRTREEMAGSGVIHVVSASGLQVFVFGLLTSMALRLFPLPRWVHLAVLAALLLVYALAAGLQPQIVRAAVMTLLGMGAYLVKRDPDALSALSVSGIGYLLWRPEAIYGMAFQLSFVAVACIALFCPPAKRVGTGWKEELIRWAHDFLRLSLMVSLATTPLVAYYLGVISAVMVLANLLVGWSLPLVLAIAFLGYGIWYFVPVLGTEICTRFVSPLVHWIGDVAAWFGGGMGAIQVPQFNALWLIAFYGAWMMIYRRRVVQP